MCVCEVKGNEKKIEKELQSGKPHEGPRTVFQQNAVRTALTNQVILLKVKSIGSKGSKGKWKENRKNESGKLLNGFKENSRHLSYH